MNRSFLVTVLLGHLLLAAMSAEINAGLGLDPATACRLLDYPLAR